MQTIYLQPMITFNAARITQIHEDIEGHIRMAKHWKGEGEISFSIEDYKAADRLRKKLTKAVELQRAMKAEVEYNHCAKRIEDKFQRAMGRSKQQPTMLLFEIEDSLDALLSTVALEDTGMA